MAVARCFTVGCTWTPEVRDVRLTLDALHLHAASHRPTEADLARTFAGAA